MSTPLFSHGALNVSLVAAQSSVKSPVNPGTHLLRQFWIWRIVFMLTLFVVLGFWLTLLIDTGSINGSASGFARYILIGPMVLRSAITFFVLIPLLSYHRILSRLLAFFDAARTHENWWTWYLVHWLSFGLFIAASSLVFQNGTGESALNLTLLIIWISSVIASFIGLACSLAPPRYWWHFVRTERWYLLTAATVALCVANTSVQFQSLWAPLGESTFRLVEFWLSLIYPGSIISDADRRLIGTPSFYVEIAPQCSGYEGIGLISAFVLVFLAVFRRQLRFPHAWLLWPIGVASIWICNSLRIAALIVIGAEYSADLALGGFHSQAGWILFNGVSIGVMALGLRCKSFARSTSRPVPTICADFPYLTPFLALTSVNLLIGTFADEPKAFYAAGVVVSLGSLWLNRGLLRRINWSCSIQAVTCGIVAYLIWIVLAWRDRSMLMATSSPLRPIDEPGGLLWIMVRFFGSTVTVPIVEELAFRGFFVRRLVRADFENLSYRNVPIWAILVSSLAFGMLHQLWIAGIVVGICYAWTTRTRNSLSDAVYAHAITNGLLSATVILSGADWLW